jgi:aspartate/glutamate racemase
MMTVDFGEMEPMQNEGLWAQLGFEMQNCARSLELAGAEFIVSPYKVTLCNFLLSYS